MVGGCPVGAGARGLEREVAEEAVLGEAVADADVAHRAGRGGDGDQSLLRWSQPLLPCFVLRGGGRRMALQRRNGARSAGGRSEPGIGWCSWFVGRDRRRLRSEMRS